jgi:hypothetical protein
MPKKKKTKTAGKKTRARSPPAKKTGPKAKKPRAPPVLEAEGEDLEGLRVEMSRELARLRQQYMEAEHERESLKEKRAQVEDLKDSISTQLDTVMQERSGAPGGGTAGGGVADGPGLQSAILDGPGRTSGPETAAAQDGPSAAGEAAGPGAALATGAASRPAPPRKAATPHPSPQPRSTPQAPSRSTTPPAPRPTPQPTSRQDAPAVLMDAVTAEEPPRAEPPSGAITEDGVQKGGAVDALPAEGDYAEPTEYQDPGESVRTPVPADMPAELVPLVNELALLRDQLGELDPAALQVAACPTLPEAAANQLEGLEVTQGRLEEQVSTLISDVKEKVGRSELSRLKKSIGRLEQKNVTIVEEVGLGEELDVGKMPPHIIEIVYQATLDDIVRTMYRELGPYDSEKNILNILEDIHKQTSGSELFFFDGEKLNTRNLADAIQRKLISAKQVHMTYVRLQDRLQETLPDYKVKNFRAMIRLKSQEFTIDRVLKLMDSLEVLNSQMDSLRTTLLDRMSGHEALNEMVQGQMETLESKMVEMADVGAGTADRMRQIEEGARELAGKGPDTDGLSGLREVTEELGDNVRRLQSSLEEAVEEMVSVNKVVSSRLTKLEVRLDELAAGTGGRGDGNGSDGDAPQATPRAIPVPEDGEKERSGEEGDPEQP